METMRPQKGEATFSGLCDFDIWRWDVDPGYLALDSIKATKNAYHLPKELTPEGGGFPNTCVIELFTPQLLL